MAELISADQVDRFVGHLVARRADAAVDLALGLADEGVPIAAILTDLVGVAQVEVGERWYRNDSSVADEHASTGIADTVLTLLGAHAGRTPSTGPHVAVLCPEGEWHTMALRLAARVLELHGVEVTFLGASLPADHLGRFLDDVRPDLVAVSCSTPLAFPGVLAAVSVAHRARVPVVAGGRAFGDDDRRAAALGVDDWMPSAATGVERLSDAAGRPLRAPEAGSGAHLEWARDRPRLVADVMEALRRRFPLMAGYTSAQFQRTSEDVGQMVQFAEAALLVGEPEVLDEHLRWLRPWLESRDVSPATLDLSLAVLGERCDGAMADLFGERSAALAGT